MKKIIFSLTAILALGAVANANSLVDGLAKKATTTMKDKAEKKATQVATDQAKKSLTDGSLKEKAVKKATEMADKHTNGKASKAIDAVKSFTK